MIKTTSATTRSRWIRLPPTCRLKPKSHRIPRTTKIVQSIAGLLESNYFILASHLSALPESLGVIFHTPNTIGLTGE
jgi:hypothetical protein